MSLVRKLAGETVIYGLGAVLPKVLNFIILVPYLTNILGNEEYGIYGILYAYVASLIAVYTLRLESAFFRFSTISDEKESAYSTSLLAIIGLSIILSICIYFGADRIAANITKASDGTYVRLFAIILGLDAVAAVPFARLRLENRPLRFSMIKIMNVVVQASLIVFCLSVLPRITADGSSFLGLQFREEDQLFYIFAANLIASAAVLLLLIPELSKFSSKFSMDMFAKMFKYSWPLIIIGVAAAINSAFDRVFLNSLISDDPDTSIIQAGIYNGASKIAVLMSLFATAFNYAAEPFFFKQFKNKSKDKVYAEVALTFAIAGSFVFLSISLFIDLFKHMIGPNYWSGLTVVPILLLAYLFLGLHYNFSIWYKLKDKTIYGAFIGVGGVIITVLFNILLIPKIGMTGAAYSALACFVMMSTASYITGQKHHPIAYPFGRIWRIILIAVGVYILTQWLLSYVPGSAMNTLIPFLSLVAFTIIVCVLERGIITAFLKPTNEGRSVD